MVVETVIATVRVFQTNNNNNNIAALIVEEINKKFVQKLTVGHWGRPPACWSSWLRPSLDLYSRTTSHIGSICKHTGNHIRNITAQTISQSTKTFVDVIIISFVDPDGAKVHR